MSSSMSLCSNCQRTLSLSGIDTRPSPVPSLFTTNNTPNRFQAGAIRDAIACARADLHTLDDEIARVQNHLLALQAKRASIQRFTDDHGGIRIRELPNKLVVHIFTFTLLQHPSYLDPEDALLLLGQICRSWRAISRAKRGLWASFKRGHARTRKNEKLDDMVFKWLEQSDNRPLTLQYQQTLEDIELPEIHSEYESESEDWPVKFKWPSWTQSSELLEHMERQRRINPNDIFGPAKPVCMEDVLTTNESRRRARHSTGSANWIDNHRLTEDEERGYARRMGYQPQIHFI